MTNKVNPFTALQESLNYVREQEHKERRKLIIFFVFFVPLGYILIRLLGA